MFGNTVCLTDFPTTKLNNLDERIPSNFSFLLYCSCQLPMSYGPMVLCRECDLWYHIACEKVDLNIYEENKNDYMCLLCSNLNQERNTDICDDEIVGQEEDRQNVVKQESGRDGMRDESGQEQVREESDRDEMRNESGQKGVEQESGGGDWSWRLVGVVSGTRVSTRKMMFILERMLTLFLLVEF